MTLNSLSYLLFLVVVFLLFYLAGDRRRLVLLAASYAFYTTLGAPYLLAVLFAVTATSYGCALRIAAAEDEPKRKRWLWGGISACASMLVALKYLSLLPWPHALQGGGALAAVVVCVGVSYFILQAISYLTDVYLEKVAPEEDFVSYALFLAFFPKLLQGPIERGGDLLPQLKKPYAFDYHAMRSGLLLFTWGFFKKVAIADRLAMPVGIVYSDVHSYQGFPLILATWLYAIQLYCDFSGYTDMARGSARLFGIELSENFQQPYFATSIADFWRRWHISFSRWILDYLFMPMQMAFRDLGRLATPLALVLAFLISGLWHGATWCFLIWGGLHGLYLAASILYRPYRKKLHRLLHIEGNSWLRLWQVLVTFNMVSLAWVFFRAGSVSDAWHVVTGSLHGLGRLANVLHNGEALREQFIMKNGYGGGDFALTLVSLAILALSETAAVRGWAASFHRKRVAIRWSCYSTALILILLLGKFRNVSFIYNRF